MSVSDMLEGHDYHLRLCRKDFICTSAGAEALVGTFRRPFAAAPVGRDVVAYLCLCLPDQEGGTR